MSGAGARWSIPPTGPTYVQGTDYDEAGRVTLRTLGNNAVQTRFTYYPWQTLDQGGGLQRLFSQTPGTPAVTRQDFRFTYDKNGNITAIQDYVNKVGQDPHTQTFTYRC